METATLPVPAFDLKSAILKTDILLLIAENLNLPRSPYQRQCYPTYLNAPVSVTKYTCTQIHIYFASSAHFLLKHKKTDILVYF